ncbi:hypothetical protein AAY473_023376 [Plecturocebus cupreus]
MKIRSRRGGKEVERSCHCLAHFSGRQRILITVFQSCHSSPSEVGTGQTTISKSASQHLPRQSGGNRGAQRHAEAGLPVRPGPRGAPAGAARCLSGGEDQSAWRPEHRGLGRGERRFQESGTNPLTEIPVSY